MNVRDIQRAVCKEFGISWSDLILVSRTAKKVRARQVGYYVVMKLTDKSYREIGASFVRDHTTVGFGLRQIRRDMKRDAVLNAKVHNIITRLSESAGKKRLAKPRSK